MTAGGVGPRGSRVGEGPIGDTVEEADDIESDRVRATSASAAAARCATMPV